MTTSEHHDWPPDWINVPEDAVPQLLAEARERLQGLIAVADSSHDRSVTLGLGFATGAFALFTLAATVFNSKDQHVGMIYASGVTGLLLMAASAFCFFAALPYEFNVMGYEPRDLVKAKYDTLWMKVRIIEDIQRRIDKNVEWLEHSANLIKLGIGFALMGMMFGTLISSATVLFITGHDFDVTGRSSAMAFIAMIVLVFLAALAADMREKPGIPEPSRPF